MEVILLERVAKLGQMGDVVRVKDGFARNYLLAQGQGAARHAGQQDQVRNHEGRARRRATSPPRATPTRSPPSSTARTSWCCARPPRPASSTARCRRAISPACSRDGGLRASTATRSRSTRRSRRSARTRCRCCCTRRSRSRSPSTSRAAPTKPSGWRAARMSRSAARGRRRGRSPGGTRRSRGGLRPGCERSPRRARGASGRCSADRREDLTPAGCRRASGKPRCSAVSRKYRTAAAAAALSAGTAQAELALPPGPVVLPQAVQTPATAAQPPHSVRRPAGRGDWRAWAAPQACQARPARQRLGGPARQRQGGPARAAAVPSPVRPSARPSAAAAAVAAAAATAAAAAAVLLLLLLRDRSRRLRAPGPVGRTGAHQVAGECGRAFAAVRIVLAQEACEPRTAVVLHKPAWVAVAASPGAIALEQLRRRTAGAEILAARARRRLIVGRATPLLGADLAHGEQRQHAQHRQQQRQTLQAHQHDLPALQFGGSQVMRTSELAH